jgi:AraC family transcriptional regulator
MICEKHGVAVTDQRSWTDFGVAEVAYEVQWLTEPGWLTLEVEAPTLCMMATEIGGRCEFRAKPDQSPDGEYFGSGALAFAVSGAWVAIHAAEMRKARLCCFAFHTRDADYLTSEQLAAAGHLQSRYMFRNERTRTCAALLDRGRFHGDSPAFILHLSRALFAAVVEMADAAREPLKAAALTGATWDAISRYIRDNLGKSITVETLARIVQMRPERFGSIFRGATGMSVRQWQTDCRVRNAQRLLTDNPNENLSEVATLCGFADQSHFSRAFLKVVGLTPTAWLHSQSWSEGGASTVVEDHFGWLDVEIESLCGIQKSAGTILRVEEIHGDVEHHGIGRRHSARRPGL